MNDSIREMVKQTMGANGLSQGDVSRALGIKRPNLTKMLSGRSGVVPENWQRIFDYLGLELVVKEKHD
jgi:plasmid maintenance system antidote protein VapI